MKLISKNDFTLKIKETAEKIKKGHSANNIIKTRNASKISEYIKTTNAITEDNYSKLILSLVENGTSEQIFDIMNYAIGVFENIPQTIQNSYNTKIANEKFNTISKNFASTIELIGRYCHYNGTEEDKMKFLENAYMYSNFSNFSNLEYNLIENGLKIDGTGIEPSLLFKRLLNLSDKSFENNNEYFGLRHLEKIEELVKNCGINIIEENNDNKIALNKFNQKYKNLKIKYPYNYKKIAKFTIFNYFKLPQQENKDNEKTM